MKVKKYLNIANLLFKKITETISTEEGHELSEWAKQEHKDGFIREAISESTIRNNINNQNEFDSNTAFHLFINRTSRTKRIRLVSNILKYAATVALLVVLSIIIRNNIPNTANNQIAETIAPGEQKAVLIMGDNNKVNLTNQTNTKIETPISIIANKSGKLFYNIKDTLAVFKKAKYNTLIIPKGGEYSLTLSDGTRITINSDSKIRYPEYFHGKTRKVYVEHGEAYFEVAPDASKPFIVETNDYSVTVLGTIFNISHYKNDNEAHTTLVKGKVNISSIKGIPGKSYTLNPREQFILNKNNLNVKIQDVDPDLYTIWTKGYFLFEDESLENIFKKLERWYDLEIFFANNKIRNISYSGKLPKFENFSIILELLETIDNVKFEVYEKTVKINES